MSLSNRILTCFISLAFLGGSIAPIWGQAPAPRAAAPRATAPYGPAAAPAARAPRVANAQQPQPQAPAAQGAIRAATAPFGPLTQEQQARLHLLLGYWEQRSSKVKIFTCKLSRWEYDPVFGPQDPLQPKTISAGIVRYAAPDKGEFHIQEMGEWVAPREPGGKPTWPMKPVENREHWICDGTSIFEFMPETKKLVESVLPPEMRGKAIVDGPLPFLFGAEKSKLLARYWIHEVSAPNVTSDQIWLEAYPKFARDAVNYSKITVILDKKMFLPIGLQVFATNGKSRTAYQFAERKVNHLMGNVQNFTNSFIRPNAPRGWQKVVENYVDSAPAPAQVRAPLANPPVGGQAQRPAAQGMSAPR